MCESFCEIFELKTPDSVIMLCFFFQEAENRGVAELKKQLNNGGEQVKERIKTWLFIGIYLFCRRSRKHETRF